MIFAFFALLALRLGLTEPAPCLTADGEPELCEICSFPYYRKDFDFTYSETISPFPSADCIKKISASPFRKKAYVRESFCSSDCDGSLERPYQDLYSALAKEEIASVGFLDVELEFYLLGAEHNLRTSALGLKNKHFFRRSFASITISPLFCSESNVAGCVGADVQRTVVNLKSANFSIFIARAITLKNLAFTGIDLKPRWLNSSLSPTEPLCSESALSDPSSECFIRNSENTLVLNSTLFFGLLVVDSPPDCEACSNEGPPLVTIENCQFSHLNSIQISNDVVLPAIITISKNSLYRIRLREVQVVKSFFWMGLVYSLGLSDSYQIRLQSSTKSAENTLEVVGLSVVGFNFFNIRASALSSLFSIGNLNNDSLIFNNITVASSQSSNACFLTTSTLTTSSGNSIRLRNFVIEGSSFFGFLTNISNINDLSIENLRVFNSSGFKLQTSQTNIALSNCSFELVSFQQHFLQLSSSNLTMSGCFWVSVAGFNSTSPALLSIITSYSIVPSEFFTTVFSRNISTDWLSITGCTFKNLTLPICDSSKVVRKLIIINSTFSDTKLPTSKNLLMVHVEHDTIVDQVIFQANSLNYFIFLLLSRNISLSFISFTNSNSKFLNAKCTDMGNRQIIWVLQHSLFQKCNYSVSEFLISPQQYMRGFHDFLLFNTSFIDLIYNNNVLNNNMYALRFECLQFTNITSVNFIGLYGARTFLVQQGRDKIAGYESEGMIARSNIINFNLAPLYLNTYLSFNLSDCLLTSDFFVSDKAAIFMLAYYGKFSVWNTRFSSIQTTQTVLDINSDQHQLFFLYNCVFKNNSADISLFYRSRDVHLREPASELSIAALQYGIHNSSFSFTSSVKFSSLLLSSGSDLVIFNCTFSNVTSESLGAALSTQENCVVVAANISLLNCRSGKDGGCFSFETLSNVQLINLFVHQSQAQYGGVLFVRNSRLLIKDSRFENAQALEGGVINSLSNDLEIRNSYFGASKSFLKGGHIYASESKVFISGCNFTRGDSSEEGGSIYAEFSPFFQINSTAVSRSSTSLNGILYLEGSNSVTHFLNDFACFNNSAGEGVCLYLNEGILNMNAGSLHWNSGESLLLFRSVFEFVYVSIHNYTISKNYITGRALIVFHNAENGNFTSSNVFENTLHELHTRSVLLLLRSSLFLANFSFVHRKLKTPSLTEALYLEDSKLTILASLIDGDSGLRCVYLSSSAIQVNRTLIQQCFSLGQGAAIYSSESQIHITESEVKGNQALSSGAFFFKDCFAHFNALLLHDNTQERDSDTVFEFALSDANTEITLFNSQFISSGSPLRINGKVKVFFEKCLFKKIPSNQTEAETESELSAVKITGALRVHVLSCLFLGLDKDSGLWLKFTSTLSPESGLLVSNSSFESCETSGQGGALIIEGAIRSNITGNRFLNNAAQMAGGAVFIDCPGDLCLFRLNSNAFLGNKARSGLGNILKIAQRTQIEMGSGNKYFSDSWSRETERSMNDFVGFPNQILIFSTTPDEIGSMRQQASNSSSYGALIERFSSYKGANLTLASGRKHHLAILLLDNFGSLAVIEVKSNLQLKQNLSPAKDDVANTENEQVQTTSAFTALENFTVTASPKTTISFALTFSNKVLTLTRNITVFLRECVRGEVYINKRCIPCPEKFYSLEENPMNGTECIACPKYAECPGEHFILPQLGFYRHSQSSTLLVKCMVEEACPDQLITFREFFAKSQNNGEQPTPSFTPICAKGYEGNNCAQCEEGYGMIASKFCVKCSDKASFYIKFAFGLILSVLFILYQTWNALQFKGNNNYQRSLLKLFVNHSYYLSFISNFAVDWSSMFLSFIQMNDSYLSTVPAEVVVFDCFLIGNFQKDDIFFIRNAIFSFSPLILILAAILIYLFTDMAIQIIRPEKRSQFKALRFLHKGKLWAVSLTVLTLYNLYSRLLMNAFQKLRCIQLDETEARFLQEYPHIKCWTSDSEHLRLILLIFLPNFLLWCFGWPLFLFLLLRKKRSVGPQSFHPNDFNIGKVFVFLTFDYKPQYYYWECFFYFFNLSITGLLVAVTHLHPITQGAMLILLFVIALWITEKRKPFAVSVMNNLTVLSYLLTIFTICFAVQTTLPNIKETYKSISLILVITINTFFYFLWAYHFISSSLKKFKESLNSFKSSRTKTVRNA